MLSREAQQQKTREAIQTAWANGDIIGMWRAGFDNFMTMICDRPISFQTFLDYTGAFFDGFIVDTKKQEQLNYIGGKLFLELTSPTTIQLTADFYFQNSEREWILKKKEGHVDSSRFSDWDAAPELAALRETKKLEYPIDPPAEAR